MHKNILLLTIIGLLFFVSATCMAIADDDEPKLQDYERFALVIGNKDYEYRPLTNPINDARAIKAFLLSRNFKEENIIYAENADLDTLIDKKETFLARLTAAKRSIAFVYYSGHGTQETSRNTNKLTNYLIPINNQRIKTVARLDAYSVSLNVLLGDMDALNQGLNIVLMDACRDGLPAFTKSAQSASFAPMDAKGVFIAYATASGNTADDNSLFRKSFIEQASLPQTITDVFSAVKKSLYGISQLPVFTDRTTGGDFYFTGSADDDPAILKTNYFLAKTYENKALLALVEGDKENDISAYRKAWLYALEAKKLKINEKQTALTSNTLNKLTALSIRALTPERYQAPFLVDKGVNITAIAYHPDSRVLAFGTSDGHINVLDIMSRTIQQTIKAHYGGINALSYSPNGYMLSSTSGDNTIKSWDIKSGKLKHIFKGHTAWVNSLSYSPDGHTLASASGDKTIKLWDVKSGQVRQTLIGHHDEVIALHYRIDGRWLASASYDGTVKLWDIASGQLIRTLKGHGERVNTLSYRINGDLASASDDGEIKVWDTLSGQLKQTFNVDSYVANTLSYSPDGRVLSSISYQSDLKQWHALSGYLKWSLKGRKNSFYTISYSPDGNTLALVSKTNIQFLEPQLKTLKQKVKKKVSAVDYSPDGAMLAFGLRNGMIELWNTTSGVLKHSFKSHNGSIKKLVYSSNGHVLASGGRDGRIKLWDTTSGQLRNSLQNEGATIFRYSPDGSVLASGSDKVIKLWDTASGQLKQTLKGHTSWIKTLVYHPKGSVLVSGASDHTIMLWDTQSGQLKQTLKGHEGSVYALSYSPDGQVLASASKDKTIKLWNAQSGQLKQTLKGHEQAVTALSYSPDGQVLTSASYDKTIKLWDTQSGKLKQTLRGHNDSVTSLSYSPNDHILASGSTDGIIKFWTPDILQTQALFYQYDPKQVSNALKFLWEMDLDDDGLEMIHKVRTPTLYPRQGRYYADTQYLPLLEYPAKGKTKADQLLEWLEKDSKARQKKQAKKNQIIPALKLPKDTLGIKTTL